MANTQGRQSNQNDKQLDTSDSSSRSASGGDTFIGKSSGSSGSTASGTLSTEGGSMGSISSAGNTPIANTETGGTTSTGGGTAAATARSFVDQAKATAGQAYEAVTEKATHKLEEQKTTVSEGLSSVADSVRQVGDNLGSTQTDSPLAGTAAKYTQTAAQTLDDVANYFERKSVRDMTRDIENFARRNPMIFLGAAFGLGLLAARFLKSTPPNQYGNGGNFGDARNAQFGLETGSSMDRQAGPSGESFATGGLGSTGGTSASGRSETDTGTTRNTSSTPDSVMDPM